MEKNLTTTTPKALTEGQKKVSSFNSMMERYKAQIARAAPKNFDPDRLCRVVLSLYRSTPGLMECTQESLVGGVMMCAQMGLEPGPLGEAYLVPFNNTKKDKDGNPVKVKEAQFILGYKGMMKLARRSGEISSIYGHAVYANDLFQFHYGMSEDLTHIPWHSLESPASEPGKFRGAYVIVKFKSGDVLPWFLPKAEIERHREKSKAKNGTFWTDNYEKMAIKTVVRDMQPWLPMTIEDQRTIAAFDGAVKTQVEDDMTETPNENDDATEAEVVSSVPLAEKLKMVKDQKPAAKTEPTGPQKAVAALDPAIRDRVIARGKFILDHTIWSDEECEACLKMAETLIEEEKAEGMGL